MAKWKLMTKRIALAVLTAAMLMGPATNAFAHSNENAEAEGFTFGDGARPQSRPGNDL